MVRGGGRSKAIRCRDVWGILSEAQRENQKGIGQPEAIEERAAKMSLYKRGGIWWYKFKFQGQTIRESTHSGRKDLSRDAERTRRRELETAVNRIERRDPAPLFRLAAKNWLSEKAGRAEKTIAGYKQRVAPVVDRFGDRLVCDIDREDVLAYRAKRITDGMSNRTVNYEICCLRGVLEGHGVWAKIGRKVTRLRENHDCGQAISFDEETALLTACINSASPVLYPAFVLAIDTGIRAAELRSLRHRDLLLMHDGVSFVGGEIVVPKSKTEAGKGRSIPLTKRAVNGIAEWLRRFPSAGPDSYLFPRHFVQQVKGIKLTILCEVELGQPMRSWQRAWRSALKSAGLKYRWHDLRHTFVTRLAENPEISEQTIRALAGHVSQQMLQRYSHIRRQAKEDAIAALEAQQQKILLVGGTKMGTVSCKHIEKESEATEKTWLPPRDSNPDNLLQRQVSCR
jgi:integrase